MLFLTFSLKNRMKNAKKPPFRLSFSKFYKQSDKGAKSSRAYIYYIMHTGSKHRWALCENFAVDG